MAKKTAPQVSKYTFFDYLYLVTWAVMPLIFAFYSKQTQDAGLAPRLGWLALVTLVGVGVLFTKKTKHFPFLITIAAIAVFVFWHFAGYGNALSKTEFWATFSRNGLFLAYLVLTYQLLRNGLLRFSALVQAGVLFGAISALSLVPDMLSYFGGKRGFDSVYSITGLFAHKNFATSALLMAVPFMYLATRQANKFFKYVALGALALAMLEIALLRTRGVWLGFFGGVGATVFLQLLSKQKEGKQLKLIGAGTAALALVAIAFFTLGDSAEKVLNRGNIDTRFFYWNSSVEMAKEHPLTGVGAGNWKINFPKYGLQGTNQSVMEGETNIVRPHNDMLWVLSEMGLPAWVALAVFQLLLLFICIKLLNHFDGEKRNYAMATIFALVAFAVYGLGEFPIERPVAVGLLVLLAAEAFRLAEEEHITKKELFFVKPVALNIAILALAGFGLFIAGKRISGERNAAKAVDAYMKRNPANMLRYGQAAQNGYFEIDIYNTPMRYFTGLGQLASQKIAPAEADFKEALEISPYHINTIKQLGDTYKMQGKFDLALAEYNRAIAISPQFYMAALGKAEVYFRQKNITKAVGALNLVSHKVIYPKYKQLGTSILQAFAAQPKAPGWPDLHQIAIANQNNPEQLWSAYLQWKKQKVVKK